MKAIINYFKKRQERRLRAKLALNASYGVNDLNAVYKFIKGESVPSESKLNVTDRFSTTIDGGLIFTDDLYLKGSFRDKIAVDDDKVSFNGRAAVGNAESETEIVGGYINGSVIV